MFFVKYGILVLMLATWFVGSSSIDLDFEDMQGDREKRTLILGVLFKKLLLQQALARNNMKINSTTVMPSQQMMGDSGSSNENTSPQAPEQSASPPSPQPPSPPQPAQSPTPPESSTQESPPALSMPQGIRAPQAVVQGPTSSQEFPQQQVGAISQGLPSLNAFNPSQQTLLFPPNYPFGVQAFRQLPFGPAPPLGAQAGPQNSASFPNYFPFNFQNGFFQSIPQQGSFIPQNGATNTPSQSASQTGLQNPQFAPPQQTSSNIRSPQEQTPPSGVGTSEQALPSGSGPGDTTQSPSQSTQPNPSSQEPPTGLPDTGPSAPNASIQQNPSDPGDETAQGSPTTNSGSFTTNPPIPGPSQLPTGGDGAQQNIPFETDPSDIPPSQVTGGDGPQGSLQNFPFDPQGSRPSNAQETSPGQQGPPTNFPPQPLDTNLQQQFDAQLQQQLSGNGLPVDSSNFPQNLASPNGTPQPGQPDNRFFDLRQFAGADNSVFDFPQEGGTPTNSNSEQQQQPESFQNGIFTASGEESVNDPRSNFAFRGQQFDFSSPYQDSGNFQRNFFQQNLF